MTKKELYYNLTNLHQFIWKTSNTWLSYLKNGLSLEIMKENFVFQENEPYILRNGNHLAQKNMKTTKYGTERFSNFGAEIWDVTRGNNNSSPCVFKIKIRKWIPQKYPSKLFPTYISNIGYIWFLTDIC